MTSIMFAYISRKEQQSYCTYQHAAINAGYEVLPVKVFMLREPLFALAVNVVADAIKLR